MQATFEWLFYFGDSMTTAVLMPNGKQQFFDTTTGAFLSGGKLYTFEAGTTTPKATYTTPVVSVPTQNANPIILDSRGEASVFWSGSYYIELYDSSDVLIYSKDNYTASNSSSGAANVGFSPASTISSTNVQAAIEEVVSDIAAEDGADTVGLNDQTVYDVLKFGSLRLKRVEQASTVTAVASATAGNLNGTYYWTVTYVTAQGETDCSDLSNSVTVVNKKVDLTIPVSSDSSVTARKIYRNSASAADSVLQQLVATISDNVTTTYQDNIADGSLGASVPRINTTGGLIYENGVRMASMQGTTTTFGYNAAPNNTGYANSAFGAQALAAITTGYRNSGFGIFALADTTTGARNSAFGVHALNFNVTGSDSTACGYGALFKTTASGNTAYGSFSLYENTTGSANSAGGYAAMNFNTTGSNNTAFGATAMQANTTGASNVAVGASSLYTNTTGNFNVAVGATSGIAATGSSNTAVGYGALTTNSTGSNNVAIGNQAGYFETGSYRLFIDALVRSNEADARLKALIYGFFDADTANQILSINAASINMAYLPTYANNAAAVAGGLAVGRLYKTAGGSLLIVV